MSDTSPAAIANMPAPEVAAFAAVHAVARLCRATVEQALNHLSTAQGMSRWALGLWNCHEHAPGLFTGESLFDGTQGWVQVKTVPGSGVIHYHVGAAPDCLLPRIQAQVLDGPRLGHDAGSCVVTLLAWRLAAMSDERWHRLVASHETEIELIQAQLSRESCR